MTQPNSFPRLDDLRTISPSSAELVDNRLVTLNGRDLRSRPFNLLRTTLSRRFATHRIRSLGIVSPCPGAGKSFVASNLAAAFARVPDTDVYLFDLDLRGATIGRIFGIDVEVGLEQFLLGEAQMLDRVGYRLEGQRLGIFPARPTAIPSAELIADKPCAELLAEAAARPDGSLSIFDLPPAFANDDAAIAAAGLDGFLMVVEDGKTTRKQIEDSLRLLPPGKCVGSILNRYSGGLFEENYGYGYGQRETFAGYYD